MQSVINILKTGIVGINSDNYKTTRQRAMLDQSCMEIHKMNLYSAGSPKTYRVCGIEKKKIYLLRINRLIFN